MAFFVRDLKFRHGKKYGSVEIRTLNARCQAGAGQGLNPRVNTQTVLESTPPQSWGTCYAPTRAIACVSALVAVIKKAGCGDGMSLDLDLW